MLTSEVVEKLITYNISKWKIYILWCFLKLTSVNIMSWSPSCDARICRPPLLTMTPPIRIRTRKALNSSLKYFKTKSRYTFDCGFGSISFVFKYFSAAFRNWLNLEIHSKLHYFIQRSSRYKDTCIWKKFVCILTL